MAHRYLTFILALILLGCADKEPVAANFLKQMESADAAGQKKVLMAWTEPVDSTRFGLAPNPKIDGKSLSQVVSSQLAGRDDGMLCSACHNKDDPQGGYAMPIAKNEASPGMKCTDPILGRTWIGADGWAQRFVKNPTKPANVKAVVQAWIDNGFKVNK